MKITIEVDCTPDEARAFFGLPDLRPLQTAMMNRIEEKMQAGSEFFEPETLAKAWFGATAPGFEAFQTMMRDVMTRSTSGKAGSDK